MTQADKTASAATPAVGGEIWFLTREDMEKLHGQAHSGAMLGGDNAYQACLTIEGILGRIAERATQPTPKEIPIEELTRTLQAALAFIDTALVADENPTMSKKAIIRIINETLAAPPASPLRVTGARDLVEEAACLIWAELCPGMVMGDDDLPHYEAAAKDVLALSSASTLRGRDALEPLARIGLWQDQYPDGPDFITDTRLQGYFTPDEVRAARAVLESPPEQPAAQDGQAKGGDPDFGQSISDEAKAEIHRRN